jgi:hypothetical protein
MTYSVGGLIQATDYNGFVSTGSPNINNIWSTGSGDSGWGQTAIATVAGPSPGPADLVTATQWATLVNRLSSMGSQTATSITARTAPTTGTTISVLSAVATDISSINTRRGFAAASGTEYGTFTGTTSKTTATGSGQAAWTITFTHTVTFASAAAARYFWNAGGIVRIKYGKSSTGTDVDPDWNTFAGQCGTINITGRVASAAQTIAGQSYTGTTRLGGGGGTQTTLATTTGWYSLTGGAAATTIFQLNNASSPYTADFIRTTAAVDAGRTVLTLVTTWSDGGSSGAGTTANISGGTATASPSTTITGTAPTTLVTYIPPSTTYLSASWAPGSVVPAIAASVT